MNNKKLAQTTFFVTVIIILSKLSGFLRDVALAYAYGTSEKADAFVLASSMVSIFMIIFISIGLAYMPIYKILSGKDELHRRKQFVDTTYTVLGVASLAIAILGVFSADFVVYMLAPGFSESAHTVSVAITRIMMISIPLLYIVNIGSQHLRGENRFIAPAAIGIPCNLILVIAFIAISPIYDIQGVVWCNVFGVLVQVIILALLLRKIGYNYSFSFELKNEGLRQICILTLPIFLGNAIQTINTIVDRILASSLAEGSMAALNFSNKLSLFVIGLISLGAGNVCYTKMSELGAKNDSEGLKSFLRNIINLLNLIVVPATVGLIVLNGPVVATVFQYGAFDASSVEMTSVALVFYSIGLVGFALRDMITRAFYSIQDSKTPMINGAIAVAINIIGNIVLVEFMGIGGLALATSVSAIVATLLLLYSLRKKLGALGAKEMLSVFIKACFAAVIMGIVVHFGYGWLYGKTGIVPLALILDICMGVGIYGIVILFLKVKEVDFVVAYLKRKLF